MALDYASNDEPVRETTLVTLFFEAIDRFGPTRALEWLETESTLNGHTYDETYLLVRRVSTGLAAVGLERGDRAAILSENRPEWAIADYGCLCAGVVDVPIYPTLTAHQVAYVLSDSGARLLFVSNEEQMQKGLAAAAECPQEVILVVLDPPSALPDGVITWADFLDKGQARPEMEDSAFREWAGQATPGDVATVLYTSGTTGDPKGVMLTHRNVSSNVLAASTVLVISGADTTVSFLPLSHILQRMVDFLFFWSGCTIGYARSIPTLVPDMQVIRPTIVVSVPRIYEKIYNGVMDATGLKKKIVGWAASVADRAADLRLSGREPSGLLAMQYGLADRLVFGKVKAAVGGRLRYFVSGGGPLAPALNRFFYSIGMTILEGYGLTETSPVTNVNTVEDFRIGTVGKPVPSTEVRIAEDGEILVRGPQIMRGYYKKPDATAEVIDSEGWFATGDIGHIDDDGFLSITDRKKDIIVTAGGKNIAPQPIENLLKTNRFVEQAVLVGDRRRYCALIIVPAFAPLEQWAAEAGISFASRAELIAGPAVVAHMESEVLGMLVNLAQYERPKRIALLDEELSIENGFLTPTLKVKRKVVYERLADVIAGLYEGEASDEKAR